MTRGRVVAVVAIVLSVAAIVLSVAAIAWPQTPPAPVVPPAVTSPLTELETLKAENLKLKAQLLELQRALAQAQLDLSTRALDAERQALEQAFRVRLAPDDAAVFDWQTLTFTTTPAKRPGGPP